MLKGLHNIIIMDGQKAKHQITKKLTKTSFTTFLTSDSLHKRKLHVFERRGPPFSSNVFDAFL